MPRTKHTIQRTHRRRPRRQDKRWPTAGGRAAATIPPSRRQAAERQAARVAKEPGARTHAPRRARRSAQAESASAPKRPSPPQAPASEDEARRRARREYAGPRAARNKRTGSVKAALTPTACACSTRSAETVVTRAADSAVKAGGGGSRSPREDMLGVVLSAAHQGVELPRSSAGSTRAWRLLQCEERAGDEAGSRATSNHRVPPGFPGWWLAHGSRVPRGNPKSLRAGRATPRRFHRGHPRPRGAIRRRPWRA